MGEDGATGPRHWADWECGPMPAPARPGVEGAEKGEQPGLSATGSGCPTDRQLRPQEAGAPLRTQTVSVGLAWVLGHLPQVHAFHRYAVLD